jgi:hypothetical protein
MKNVASTKCHEAVNWLGPLQETVQSPAFLMLVMNCCVQYQPCTEHVLKEHFAFALECD